VSLSVLSKHFHFLPFAFSQWQLEELERVFQSCQNIYTLSLSFLANGSLSSWSESFNPVKTFTLSPFSSSQWQLE
jgi:hypothetical protein